MKKRMPRARTLILRSIALFVTTWMVALACYPEGEPISRRPKPVSRGPHPSLDGGIADGGAQDANTVFPCAPARATSLPARSAVMSAQAAQTTTMFVRDLFNLFKSSCGGCHVEASYGGFHVSPLTFPEDMNRDEVLKDIFSDDPDTVMPPGVGAAKSRNAADDPYLQLGALLRAWYDQNRPATLFVPPSTDGSSGKDGGAANHYLLTESVGKGLTNIGNCVPVAESIMTLADDRDAFFASATALPERLDQTDLTTLDSSELALHGVVAYAPAYPLWSDDAGKLRFVRVPRGQSIQFDKDHQRFDIPDNTRFYKTFLKKVVEKDGSSHWRKLETRLIVVRHDTNDPATGAATAQNSLFGTYAWNKEETEATLVTDPLRDLKPFKDRLVTYVADEGAYDQAISHAPDGGDNLDALLEKSGAIRHWAIPGSGRCVHCHMGSPSQTFVLGFTPLQINRRPLGQGGLIEPAGDDELTQLDRLIQYGVITGISDKSDIVPLESSQGSRTPRNDYELTAQGYLLGNCSHCHNPRGYPTVQNPVLASVLDFLPGPGPNEGIFQFPLERFSPRIKRDLGGSVLIPYITPSLVDYPGQGDFNHTVAHDQPSTSPDRATGMVLAPWRSLIYRNVDTPFPYSDDLALFPHMPMDSSGFDCRITKILGDWMVSIPAVRKHPDIDETLVQAGQRNLDLGNLYDNTGTDTEPQPYVEVLPPDPSKPDVAKQQADYDAAKKAAEDRLAAYHAAGAQGLSHTKDDWSRYNYCPENSDIIDPTVTGADRAHLVPSDLKIYQLGDQIFRVPVDYQPFQGTSGEYTEDLEHVPSTAKLVWPSEGVPDRPHWVILDPTDNPPPWVPRREDWAKILRDHQFTDQDSATERDVVEMLSPSDSSSPGVLITQEVKDFASQEIPFGLWKQKDACASKLAAQHKVSDFQGSSRPKWMDVAGADPNAPVYSLLPGAAVFNVVCINCHGPQADSHGRQADTLQIMTGGDARVANLRDGLFGPTTSPGANRKAEFDVTPTSGSPTADDWAARYLSWMALGGTQKLIPKAILNVVASTPVLGIPRSLPFVDSANMLGPVQTFCAQMFNFDGMSDTGAPDFGSTPFSVAYPEPGATWDNWVWKSILARVNKVLIEQNGDAELWAKLCSIGNPLPVAVVDITMNSNGKPETMSISYYDTKNYPAGDPVGNDRGGVDTGVQTTNLMPWCIRSPDGSGNPATLQAYVASFTTSDGKPLPYCPSELVTSQGVAQAGMTVDELRRWSFRGAINGGLSVFLYLDKVSKGYVPIPPYDQCESLP
jgi:hypothetical protein